MKKISLLICLFSLLVVNLACKKYLEAKSNAKLVTPHTLKDLQGLLDDADVMNLKNTPVLGESSSDDYFFLPATYNSQVLNYQNLYQWITFDLKWPNDWSLGYQVIYNSNLSLDLLGKIDRTAANSGAWDNIQGSALFYRAYYLLNLSTQYARVYNEPTAATDMGVVIRRSSDFNEPSVRASVKDCYEQVISDAKQSIALLPAHSQHAFRPSKGASFALLARAYLYMGNYEQALFYAGEAIKVNSTLMDFNGDADIPSVTAAVPIKRFNAETIFYTEMSGYLVLHTQTRARIDTVLIGSYNAADLRRAAFFVNNGGYQQFKGNFTGNTALFFTGLATDELFLIRAESNAWLGNLDAALADVNLLLKKRWDKTKTFLPVTGTTKTEVLSKVRLERRKEMLFRGVRWIDLKRYNREGENIIPMRKIGNNIVSLLPNSPYYAMPLPVDIVSQGIPQN